MFTIIHKKDFEHFLKEYKELENYKEEINLFENDEYIFLPRLFYFNYPHPKLIGFYDKEWKSVTHKLKFLGELNERQKQVVKPFFNFTNPNKYMNSGGLKSPPGTGKTVMGVYLGCESKLKTLIIINNSKLKEQWEKSIYDFTDCKSVGIIQGDIFDVENKEFTVAMVQTLVSKIKSNLTDFYNLMYNAGFGLVLYDEYHSCISGPKFATTTLVLNTPHIIGLSATPYGNEQQILMMENTIGKIISESNKYELTPEINIVKFNSKLDIKYNYVIQRTPDLYKKRAKYNSIIMSSDIYKSLVKELIRYQLSKNHTIFNIMITQKQIETLIDYLNQYNITSRAFYGAKGKREIDKEVDNNIIATYKFGGEGFDFKKLSCLNILVPLSGKKSLIQTIGRLLREYEGKNPTAYILLETGFNNVFSKELNKIESILYNEFKCKINVFEYNK